MSKKKPADAKVRFVPEKHWPLHVAAESGNEQIVLKLLKNGVKVNGNDGTGYSPLHHAALNGHHRIVTILLEAGADVNSRGTDGVTPMLMAILSNHLNVIQKLLDAPDIDVDARTIDQATALHFAAIDGLLQVTKLLLSRGADPNSLTTNNRTPTFNAIAYNHFDVFVALLNARADLTTIDASGTNLLHVAAAAGFVPAGVEKLISNAVDVNGRDVRDFTPLHVAVNCGRIEICELLLNNGAEMNAKNNEGITPLHLISATVFLTGYKLRSLLTIPTRVAITRLLIQGGADVNIRGNLEIAPLHIAAAQKTPEVAICLLDEGKADINVRDAAGKSPLHLSKTTEMVEALLDRGADSNCADNEDYRILHFAAFEANIQTVDLLLRRGAFFDVTDIKKFRPIDYAREIPQSPVLTLLTSVTLFFNNVKQNNVFEATVSLTKSKILIHCWSCRYKTALHYSSWKGFTEMVNLLLEHKADPNINDKSTPTPLFYAASFNRLNVAVALLENGAIFDAVHPKTKETPVIYAKKEKSGGVASLLLTIEKLFTDVENRNHNIIDIWKSLEKELPGQILAIKNARNYKGLNIVEVARKLELEELVACFSVL